MELEVLQTLIADFPELISRIEKEVPAKKDAEKFVKQYDSKQHDITDIAIRPDKPVKTDNGDKLVKVTRLPLSIQEYIVDMAVAFLVGNPIQLTGTPLSKQEIDLTDVVQKTWDDNKLDYSNRELATRMMSETQCAEIWYVEIVDPTYWDNTPNKGQSLRLRMRVISPLLGDELFPVYNMFGDMIAFGRKYSITGGDGKAEEHYDLYTEENIYTGIKLGSAYDVTKVANPLGKIPVIYYSQPFPEWYRAQEMIDRLETLISNLADTNDYFGAPMIFVDGEIQGFAAKGETGKVLQGMAGAKASYLSWDRSPESIKMEKESLVEFISMLTNTPQTTIEHLKGLGTFSGIALKLLFMPAHMKAARKEEIFGKGVQRRINLIKAAMVNLNKSLVPAAQLSIKPKFEYFLPKNDQETINNLAVATGAQPIMSVETALLNNPYVTDPVAEKARIKSEGLDTQQNQGL